MVLRGLEMYLGLGTYLIHSLEVLDLADLQGLKIQLGEVQTYNTQ